MAERPPGCFQSLDLEALYSSGGDDLLADFYTPVLSRAVRYDRTAGYFTSSSFMSAAAGMARFIDNEGVIRLLVGAQLTEDDHKALLGEVSLDAILAERLRLDELTADDVAGRRLQVIAWLVREGRLTIRVGLPCDDFTGTLIPYTDERRSLKYFHSKYGVLEDAAGDRLAFHGSINESGAGWQGNYESFSVYKSWKAQTWQDHGQGLVDEFERLWRGDDAGGWRSVPLPAAVEQRLIRLIPDDDDWKPPPRDPLEPELSEADRKAIAEIRDAPRHGAGVGMLSSGIEPWPHQLAIARRICENRPRSYLLADEVGLGKTIEAGLVLRELLLAGEAETALILAPASILIQWQEELAEKFLLEVPRLDGRRLRWPGGAERRLGRGENRWRAAPVLLASSHLARMRSNRAELLDGPGWDLVFVDEAHHARRRGSRPTDSPNQMLATLKALAEENLFGSLLLASATPMQLHTHDLWDLLNLFGLPDGWNHSADAMERYYRALQEPFGDRDWGHLQKMMAGYLEAAAPDPYVVEMIEGAAGLVGAASIRDFHENPGFRPGGVEEEARPSWDDWLRANTPVRDRVFRTTRATLRRYRQTGVLDPGTVIPERRIDDRFYSLGGAKTLYDRIERYILRYYDAYLSAGGRSAPLGFIMTVYRRRLTSSFYAIRKSLERRRDVLARRGALPGLLDEDDRYAAEGAEGIDDLAGFDNLEAGGVLALAGGDLGAELAELDDFIRELENLPPDEPKMEGLYELLEGNFGSGAHDTAVIFTQYRDTLEYIRRQLLDTYRGGLACYYGGRGECWDEASGSWVRVGKETIKERFRRGEVKILLGTDSMSEGLNLQTCGWLINFDLPWNFTRVEQRIGRVDRIGGRPEVQVSNFFYEGTVEEDIYRRIRESHDWFSNVIGNAAPVLAAAEDLITAAAMRRSTTEQAAGRIKDLIARLDRAAVRLEDLDSVPRFDTDLQPPMTLPDLRNLLLSIAPVRDLLTPPHGPAPKDVWCLTLNGTDHHITFTPTLYEQTPRLNLLTWGNPLLTRLLTHLNP